MLFLYSVFDQCFATFRSPQNSGTNWNCCEPHAHTPTIPCTQKSTIKFGSLWKGRCLARHWNELWAVHSPPSLMIHWRALIHETLEEMKAFFFSPLKTLWTASLVGHMWATNHRLGTNILDYAIENFCNFIVNWGYSIFIEKKIKIQNKRIK